MGVKIDSAAMEFDDLKYAQRERLIHLDQCLTWRGIANRRDLIGRFGVSSAQAAIDFRLYLERSKTPPRYDAARKTYVAAANHKPLVPSNLTEAYESVLAPEKEHGRATLPQPVRRADAGIVALLYQALDAGHALNIRYTSMTTGTDDGQWILPANFSSDGESVHLRAFSFKHHEFRDYLPIRIDPGSTFETRPVTETIPEDRDWHTLTRIWLRPRKGLSPRQAGAVRREYGFEADMLCVETTKALEFYFDRRWGLNQPGARLERARTEYEEPSAHTSKRSTRAV